MLLDIDVVLPVRNGAKYIGSAVASLLQEDNLINSFIIIDDGSTDETIEIVSQFRSKKIRVVRQRGEGLIAALNLGLQNSDAEFIARMDADDISLQGRLAAQANFLRSNPAVAVVGTQVEYIDATGTKIGKKSIFPTSPKEVRHQLFERGCVISHPTVLMRKRAVHAVGGYRPAFQYAEDYDLWLRLSDAYEIANLSETYLHYRRHSNQVSAIASIRQSFSRDLALIAARERRAKRPDPSVSLIAPPEYADLRFDGSFAGKVILQLGIAYDGIERLKKGHAQAVPRIALRLIPMLAKQRYLGETRRQRYKLMHSAARAAFRQRRVFEAMFAFGSLVCCRLRDSRIYRRWAPGSHRHES